MLRSLVTSRGAKHVFGSIRWSSTSRPVIDVGVEAIQSAEALKAMSVGSANKKGELNVRIRDAINEHKIHETDRGSSGVQIAVLTEKINNLVRHFATHKKDKHSMRGFQGLINKRRKLMQYMKRKDFDNFLVIVKKLGLEKEATQLGA